MAKKQESAVGYRPSEKIKKVFAEFCGEGSVLSRAQLIEVAMQYLVMRPNEEMERIIWGLLKGDSERVKNIHDKDHVNSNDPQRVNTMHKQKKIRTL